MIKKLFVPGEEPRCLHTGGELMEQIHGPDILFPDTGQNSHAVNIRAVTRMGRTRLRLEDRAEHPISRNIYQNQTVSDRY